MARWLVERPKVTDTSERFEDVGASAFALHASGALIFGLPEDDNFLVYAPGQWLTVCQAAD